MNVTKRYGAVITKIARSEIGSRRYTVTASTGGEDYERDTIDPRGWEIPRGDVPLQINHSHDVRDTVGRAFDFHLDGDRVRCTIELAPAGVSPVIDDMARRLDAGLIRDVSVAFADLEAKPRSDGSGGIAYSRQRLLELSLVVVGANPAATIDRAAVAKWLGKTAAVDDVTKALQLGGALMLLPKRLNSLVGGQPAPPTRENSLDGISVLDLDDEPIVIKGMSDAELRRAIVDGVRAALRDPLMRATGKIVD